jgi:hypothetical protein
VAALVLLWLGLSSLIVVAWGDPEAFLRRTIGRSSRADAFEHLNGIAALFWIAHTALVLIGIAAARSRRPDVVKVLLIGPGIALMICLLNQDRSDPNWFVAVAVCTIGWLVSSVASAVYWAFRTSGAGTR